MEESPQQILEDILDEINEMIGDLKRIKKLMDSKQHILEERLQDGQISRLYFDVEMHELGRSKTKLSNYARDLQSQRSFALNKLRDVETQ